MLGCNSQQIAVSSSLFVNGFTLWNGQLSYRVGVVVTNADGDQGSSFINFMLNAPPQNGNCTVSPVSGESALTKYTISCFDWFDTNGVANYQFFSEFAQI